MVGLGPSLASAEQSPRPPQPSFSLALPPTLSQKPPSGAAMTMLPLSGRHRVHLQQPLLLFHPQHPVHQKSEVSPMSPTFPLLPHLPIHATHPLWLIELYTGSTLPGKKDLQDTLALGDTHRASGEVKTLGPSNGDTYFLGSSPCQIVVGPGHRPPVGQLGDPTENT